MKKFSVSNYSIKIMLVDALAKRSYFYNDHQYNSHLFFY